MPELDGFELAAMIREHPRFQKTAMIFISAIHLTDVDRLRGYEMGAVDYVPVPVGSRGAARQGEGVRRALSQDPAARTAQCRAGKPRRRAHRRAARLRPRGCIESEQRRSLALAAGNMGSWDWDAVDRRADVGRRPIPDLRRRPGDLRGDARERRSVDSPEDWERLLSGIDPAVAAAASRSRPNFASAGRTARSAGVVGTAAATVDNAGERMRVSGVTVDITERKQAEERQLLLAREVDHRAKNALDAGAVDRAAHARGDINEYVEAVEGRIKALSRAHTMLSHVRWQGADLGGLVDEELAPYTLRRLGNRFGGRPKAFLDPSTAQTLALALHELATNAAKYGALSSATGRLELSWSFEQDRLVVTWDGKRRVRGCGGQRHLALARRLSWAAWSASCMEQSRSNGGRKACAV